MPPALPATNTIAMVQTGNETMPFVYSPLQPITPLTRYMIRILTILPGTTDEPLVCELSERSAADQEELFESVDYEALSYTWGGDITDSNWSIALNGCSFIVTSNLENALRALRYEGEKRTLWVDAICINQEDATDKERQIRQMHVIYSRATTVLVWLGLSSSNTKLAFKLCEEIYDCYFPGMPVQESQAFRLPSYSYYSAKRIDMVKNLVTPEYALSWLALHSLMERPYWKRAWVCQEVVLARKVVCYWGEHQLPWEFLAIAIEILNDNFERCIDIICSLPAQISGDPGRFDWDEHLSSARRIATRRTWSQVAPNGNSSRSKSYNLLEFLFINGYRQCKYPHDTIYSTLGLLPPFFNSHIPIDYDLPPERLYCYTTKSFIKFTGSLDILALSQHSHLQEWASWAPDWSRRARSINFSTDVSCFHPTVEMQARVTFSDREWSLMTIEGFRVDSIAEVGMEWKIFPDLKKCYGLDWTTTFNTQEEEAGGLGAKPVPWRFKDSAQKLYIAALNLIGKNDSLWLEPIRVFLRTFDWLYKQHFDTLSNELEPSEEFASNFNVWYAQVSQHIVGRTIVKTKNGHIGLASNRVVPGDIVVMLPGLNNPAVIRLRKENDGEKKYMWISESWFEDFMYGRAVDDHLKGVYKMEKFALT